MPPPPENTFGTRLFLQRLRNKCAVGLADMKACLACALVLRDREGRIVHAERAENVIAEIAIDGFATCDFHQPADPVETAAIGPSGVRIEHQRRARQGWIVARSLDVANDIRVPKLIAESGCMRQQVAQRDGLSRGAQLRRPLRIETIENLGDSSVGSILAAGSSSLILPRSTSCIAATEVSSLTIEAMRKTVSVDILAAAPMLRTPNAPW